VPITVPLPIGFGTWPLGGRAYGPVDLATAVAALERAYQVGVRLFDTANIYGDGRAEDLLGRSVAGHEDAVIVSKAGYISETESQQDFSESHILRSVEGSLMRLRRNNLDVLLLHSPPKEVLLHGHANNILDRLREKGLVQQTGVSLRSIYDYEAALSWDACTVIEVIFNLLDQRAIETGLLEQARQRKITIIARVPLCFGFLSGAHSISSTYSTTDQRNRWPREQIEKWMIGTQQFQFLSRFDRSMTQAALAFCIAVPGVNYVIPGMKSPLQVEHNVAACDQALQLTKEELDVARATWSKLKHIPPDEPANTGQSRSI
jgi:aryl-alcohol dehydrogenase-like predicted oxidoreductase